MSNLARGCSGVIECKIEKLLKEYSMTYQMEGRNKYINKIWFSVIFRAEISSTDQDEILWGEEGETSGFLWKNNTH
jgi:hypothetical protein